MPLQLEGLKAFVEGDLRWRPHTAQLLKYSIVRQIQANCKLREVVEILLQCAYGSKVCLMQLRRLRQRTRPSIGWAEGLCWQSAHAQAHKRWSRSNQLEGL